MIAWASARGAKRAFASPLDIGIENQIFLEKTADSILIPINLFVLAMTLFFWCFNLSGGVELIVWFTTNGMCVKNNTIVYVARASNGKRDCDAWFLLLLTAAVRSFAHMQLGISDRNTGMKLTLHKSQVHSYSVMHWWRCRSLMSSPLPTEAGCESRKRIVLLLIFIA